MFSRRVRVKGDHSATAAVCIDRSSAVDRRQTNRSSVIVGRGSTGAIGISFFKPDQPLVKAQECATNQVKRRMIKRTAEYPRPKMWCPRADYHSPEDGISMSITSAYPSANEGNGIAAYRGAEEKPQEDANFVLRMSQAMVIDTKCHRYISS